ncbi:striatin-interacting protein 2 isoform X7 [Bos mutus]|uniref:striatin-interacting protein 2 isoform X7 n=1 Tax=Bos mutus TaxID=72004 RepID=UPI0038B41FE8
MATATAAGKGSRRRLRAGKHSEANGGSRRALWTAPPWNLSMEMQMGTQQSCQNCTATPKTQNLPLTGGALKRISRPKLSKAFEEKNLLKGPGIRGAHTLRSLSKKERQQLTLHLYGLLSSVQGEEWLELEEDAQKAYVMGLLDRLEVVSRERRLKVARAVLYLAQGTFGECDSEVDVLHWSRYNCFLLYQMGTFSAFLELLHMEIDNSQACSSALRKPAISIADSTELRVLLSVLYLMVENIRLERETDSCGWRTARETFRTELSFSTHNQEPFALLLFSMVTKFCSGLAPHFPIKKVLLLLWKVVMFTLGGFEHLQALKVQKRAELGLPPLAEDSIQVVKSMRAASPPSYTLDLGESQLAPPPSKLRGRRGSRRQLLTKQDSLDIYNERDLFKTEEPATEEEEESASDGERTLDGELDLLEQDPLVPPPPSQAPLSAERVAFPKGLPWAPKVRQKDIEHFLEMSRNKFIGFTLGQDTDTLVGLPRPIHESVKTLKQHKYVSIADVQIKNEEELEKCPMSLGEEVVPETPCEILYQGMLYSLPQYMIALLKILLAAAPTSKAKTDSINILADVLPEEMPITVLQSMKLGIDVNRHKEIIVKSISALLLLLLKHFKLNHIYQFEYVSQHLVFANCIPLILKFFNQNILSYITAKNGISVLDYPCCTIQDLPELTTESLNLPGSCLPAVCFQRKDTACLEEKGGCEKWDGKEIAFHMEGFT